MRKNKVLFFILVFAAALRFVGTNPGFHPYHSDEGMSYSSAVYMIQNLNLDPGRYDYPSLIPIIHAIVYILFFIPLFVLKSLIFFPEELPIKYDGLVELWQLVAFQNQQTSVLFWGRYLTALFSVGVVFLAYKVTARFFDNKYVGIVAAFLTAVNFRQVLGSHLALPDIYNAFFLLLSFWLTLKVLEKPSKKNYLLAGLSIGLSFSNKFQLFSLFPFLLAHLWVVRQTKRIYLKELFLAGMAAGLVALLINPNHLIRWEEFQAITSYNVFKYRVGQKIPSIYALSYLYHIGIGKLASIAALLGIFVALLKFPARALLLFSVIFPFFYIFAYYTGGGYYTRNFVTITPFLLIFAALFILEFWNFLAHRLSLRKSLVYLGIAASAFLVSYEQINNALVNSYYYSKPWEFEQARNWAAIHLPEGARVVSHPWDKYPRNKELEIIPWERNMIFSVAEMREEGAEYAYLNLDWITLSNVWWMNRPVKDALYLWQKPNAILANSLTGPVAQELASFSVGAFVKPWQAPDMNILIVKIPQTLGVEDMEELASFTFDNQDSLEGWSLIDGDEGPPQKMGFDPDVGKENKGSVKIEKGTRRFPVILAASPVFEVEKGRAVVVEGWIKTDRLLSKEQREGVLRVDFYKENPGGVTLRTRSLYSSVSSRVYGSDDWVQKKVVVIPPEDARFATVSLQGGEGTDLWIDDIVIYQSEEVFEDPRKKQPYIDYRLPEDVLFPYSQGGL